MIVFTRLNQGTIALNPDLIERVEANPDTVIWLVSEKRFLVTETLDQVVSLITDHRAYVIARSTQLPLSDDGCPSLRVVPEVEVRARRTISEANHSAP
jgi:flagellar protein FlbD